MAAAAAVVPIRLDQHEDWVERAVVVMVALSVIPVRQALPTLAAAVAAARSAIAVVQAAPALSS